MAWESEEEVLTLIQVVNFPEILDSLFIQEAPVFSGEKIPVYEDIILYTIESF